MEIPQRLKQKREARQKIVDDINEISQQIEELNQRKQALLQDALRLDGAVRVLEELVQNDGVQTSQG